MPARVASGVDRDLHALDAHALLPRLLHGVDAPDLVDRLLDATLPAPLIPAADGWDEAPWPLVRVDVRHLPESAGEEAAARIVRVPVDRMAVLVPTMRRLSEVGPAAVLLDLTPLADAEPFGTVPWRPRRREELAELRGAVGCPLWIDGIASPADAEVAGEAGAEAIVLRSAVGRRVGGVSTPELLPETVDAVAGTVAVHVGGPVRSGVDLFRYLALGAEAILPDPGPEPRRLTAELRYAMRLTGCATLSDVGYEALFAPLWEEDR